MDTIGYIYLITSIVAIVGYCLGMWFLSRKLPSGVVLIVSVILFATGHAINPSNIRVLYVIKGSITMMGFLGIILGIVDLVRRKRSSKRETEKGNGEVCK